MKDGFPRTRSQFAKAKLDSFDHNMFTNQDLDEIYRYIEYFDWVHPEHKGQFFYHSFQSYCSCCGFTGHYFSALEYVSYLTIDQIQALHDRGHLDLTQTDHIADAIQKWSFNCLVLKGVRQVTSNISHVMEIIERFCDHSEIAKYIDHDSERPWLDCSILDIIYTNAETIRDMPTYIRKFSEWGMNIPDQHYLFSRIINECDIPSGETMIALGYDVSRFHFFHIETPPEHRSEESSAYDCFYRLLKNQFDTTVQEAVLLVPYLSGRTRKEQREWVTLENQTRQLARKNTTHLVTKIEPFLHFLMDHGFNFSAVLAGTSLYPQSLNHLVSRCSFSPLT